MFVLSVLGAGFFLIGTVVGSFLNVCVYRIPLQKSLIWPGSRCPRCFAAIAGFDNIPIVSWIALRGECRRCGLPISLRYPLVEALTGALFLGAFLVDVAGVPRPLLGTGSCDSTGGSGVSLPLSRPSGCGGAHRRRLLDHPGRNHDRGHGVRNCAGDHLARKFGHCRRMRRATGRHSGSVCWG